MWVRSHRSIWGYGAGIVGSLAIAVVPTVSRPALAASSWQFDPNTQALEVNLPEGVTPRYFLLAEPARIVLDLPIDIGTTETQNTYSGPVRQVRAAQFQPGLTRIVLELAPGTTLAPRQVELRQLEASGGNRWILRPLVVDSSVPEVASTPDLPVATAPTEALPPSVTVPPAPSADSSGLPSVAPTAPIPPVATAPAPMPSTPPAADLTSEVSGIEIPVSPPPAPTIEVAPMTPEADGLPDTFLQPGRVQPEVQVPLPPADRPSRDLPTAEPTNTAIAPSPAPEPTANTGNAQDLTVPPATRLSPTGRTTDTAPAAVPDLPATPLRTTVSSEVVRVPNPPAIPRRAIASTPPPAVPEPEPEVTAPPEPVAVVPPTQPTEPEVVATPPLETVAVTPQPPSVPLRSITFGQPLEDESPRADSTVAVAPTRSGVLLPANTILKLRYPRDTALLLDANLAWQEVLVLDEDLREAQTGQVLVPAGTQVIGRFEAGRRGSRFIAQAISLQGRNLKFSAESEPIDGDRQVSHNQLLRNSGIGAAAATVIGGFSGVGLLAGLAAGAATTYVTAPQAAVIQPQQIIEVRVIEDLPRSLLE